MTPKARLERIKKELAALVSERPSAVYFVPVGLVKMALFFVRSALREIEEKEVRVVPTGGGERGLPRGDW